MADEQIIVDIKVEDKEVKQAEKSIDNLTDSIEDLGKEIKDARDNNKKYKKTIADLDKQLDEGTLSAESHKKQTKLLNKEIVDNNRTIAKSAVELSKLKSQRTANIKLVNSERNSLGQLEAKASLLNKAITKQTKSTKEGREEFERLEKELKEVNEAVNKQRKAFADNTKNIGNYPEVVAPAIISLDQLGEGMENVGGASAASVGGIKSMGTAFKALLANPVVLVLAAIVGALSALFSAFKRSESGSKLLSKAMAGLRGIMAVVTKLADSIGKAFTSSMDDAEESTVGFWEALKTNFINRIQGLLDLTTSIGDAIAALFSGSAEEMEKAGKKVKNALIAIGTGLDEAQFEEAKKALEDLAEEAARITQLFLDLEEAQRKNRGTVRFLEKDIAKLSAEFEQLAEVAGDDTRNLQEMRQAAIDAGAAASRLAERQVSLAKVRLSLINQEVSTRKSAGENIQDILDDQAAAEVALTDARSQAAIAQQKILIEQRKIERDIFEQNLDILLDVGDKIKTEQEKAIQNESISLDRRKALLEGSRAALAANFSEIKKEYELYGITAEQINEVINASDAKQTNEKLKALGLNEIANNRLREIILERKQAELDFNDLSKDLTDEEAERRGNANTAIAKLNSELALSQIDDAEELKSRLIEIEKAKLQALLTDETLLAEERKQLTLTTEAAIQIIEDEFNEEKKEKEAEDREDRLEIIEEAFEDIIDITKRFAGEEAAIFSGIAQGIVSAFEDGKISAEGALQGISIAANAVFDGLAERRANDLSQIEASREKELELAKGNKDAQDAINIEFDKKSAVLKLKQFKADKAKAIIDISIATLAGAAKALPNLILAGVVTAFGLAQGVAVAAKKPPKFGKGTRNIVSIGGSHASGNDVDVVGYSGGQSQYLGKVEKGEAMPVIRKSAANDYRVAMLNGQFSPRSSRTFQDGTNDIAQQTTPQNNDLFVSQLVSAFSNIEIVTKVEDITKGVRKKAQIVDGSKV